MSAHRENPADLLREYKVFELEQIAESYHRGLDNGFSIPVDIDRIIEGVEGIDLDIYPRLKANHGILGMTGVDENGTIIVYIDDELADQESMQRRYRMTVAEELSHILIHGDAIRRVKHPNDFLLLQSHPNWNLYDRNAKRLAAALLMPARTIHEDAREWYTKLVHKMPMDIRYSNPEVVKKFLISKLADHYDVSVASMGFRLGEWPIQIIQKIEEAMRDKIDFLP